MKLVNAKLQQISVNNNNASLELGNRLNSRLSLNFKDTTIFKTKAIKRMLLWYYKCNCIDFVHNFF